MLYESQSISSYVVLRGKMPLCTSTMTAKELTCKWPDEYHSYPTFWLGMEDIRFCDESTVLLTVPEKNPSGNPCIFRGILKGSCIEDIIRCEPSKVEKNWMPYMDSSGSTQVIYSVKPFQRKDVVHDTKETIPLSSSLEKDLEGYHGSTNGIVYNCDWRLFLIHVNKERSYHKWLLFNPTTKEIRTSKSFVFFQYSYIEFPCSLCEYNGKLYISLGLNDDKAVILTVEKKDVDSSFV